MTIRIHGNHVHITVKPSRLLAIVNSLIESDNERLAAYLCEICPRSTPQDQTLTDGKILVQFFSETDSMVPDPNVYHTDMPKGNGCQ